MLTAVESTGSHLGSGRSYNAHHLTYGVSNGPSPSITAGTGLNSYATNPVPAAMSAEFVKPHPKMGRYGSLPSSRHSDGASPGSNGVTHSPGSKYKFNSACADQPVNLVTSSAQSDGSGAQVMASGIDKLKSEFDLMKAANIPGNFADFLYGRHAAAAAAAAAGFLAPQSTYSSLMYPPTAPAPQQMYPAESQRSSVSPGKVAPIGRGNSDSATPFHHLQQQQQQPRSQGGSTGNSLTGYGYSGQPTKILKGASPGFILPPPPPPPSMSMIPTQAELEAYHAYHQEMGRGMYYNGHVPLPEHLIPVHRMQSSVSHLHTPTPQSPVSMSMCRGSQQQSSSSSISKRQPNGGAIDSGLYHQPQSHRSQSSGIGEKGPKGDKNNNIGFKVPSGKEGSMKHRLLTTNSVKTKERKGKAQKQMCASYGTSNIIKSNFNKGVLIELGNGELKPVEEMRTEDFILSSNVTPSLEMIDSTVLRITPTSFAVILTLSNSASKLNIDLTVAPEHPFFVYRQGWASCNPEGTFQMHGLKCRRLEVGDVCISLMQKDRQISGDFSDTLNAAVRINSGSSSSSTSSSLSSPPPPPSSSSAYSASQEEPQNLSRKQSPRGLIEGTTYHPSLSAPPPSSSAHAFVHTTHLLSHAPQQQARSFSSLKHNYLAAFEQAAASAKINGPVLSHSIKNIVMGGIDDDKRSESSPAIADPATRHAQFSSESASKRRYSAPDNIYGDSPALIGDLEPPPKKIASH